MKIRRTLGIRVMPSLLVALFGVVIGGQSAPASAATSTTTVQQVRVSGIVSGSSSELTTSSTESFAGAGTESVSFSGQAVLRAVVTDDPDFGTVPIVVLTVDLSNITGVGSTSRTKYVTSNRSIIQRRLRNSDAVQFTFPFWPSGTTGITSSRVGSASFSLTFDFNAKTLTGASGSVTSP